MAEPDDQASQLLRIARLAWATGDAERALRLVQRSLRLRDSSEGRELLSEYESRAAKASSGAASSASSTNQRPASSQSPPASAASSSTSGATGFSSPSSSSSASSCSGVPSSSSPQPRQQQQTTVKREPADPPKKARTFTQEQQQVAREIVRKGKDYYAVLGVLRTATSKEITSAFRKQARLLHPDKNPAPEADEAFKLLNRAHECLGDEHKRRMYDVSGRDESVPEYVRPAGRRGAVLRS